MFSKYQYTSIKKEKNRADTESNPVIKYNLSSIVTGGRGYLLDIYVLGGFNNEFIVNIVSSKIVLVHSSMY